MELFKHTGMNAIIVDDEPHAVKNLQALLRTYVPTVRVTGTAGCTDKAVQLLQRLKPDIIFLDIKLREKSGFDLLAYTGSSMVIFVTAYEEFSLQALKASALDYLLKPVDIEELKTAVQKAAHMLTDKNIPAVPHQQQLRSAATSMRLRSLTISDQQGFEVVPLNDIIFIEADGNYSVVYLTNLQKIVATRQVGEFEEMLTGNGFFRIHKSAIINLKHLKSYDSREGHVAKMSDGSSVAISGRRLSDFMKAVDHYTKDV
ncbi:LytR/AlgR family response regulator transcription factor [Chitinophagaceae bacterium MMS25-I14]